MYQVNPEVSITVNDRPIKFYGHEGRIFVEAKEGFEYKIKIANHGSTRILAIPSVDGINCLNGQVAGPDDVGYVIAPYSTYSIAGFRTSNDEIAPFRFSKKGQSYAAKNQDTNCDVSNCGVIGLRCFEEVNKVVFRTDGFWHHSTMKPYWVDYGYTTDATAPAFQGGKDQMRCMSNQVYSCSVQNSASEPMGVASASFDMGTAFSNDRKEDKVTDTEFERGRLLSSQDIFYASRESLIKMGIKLDKEVTVNFPSAFPGRKFCAPPK